MGNLDAYINTYSSYVRRIYRERVQKISIDAGFTCPNRDGSKGVGGCHYCNNLSFTGKSEQPKNDITRQINDGIQQSKKQYKNVNKYFAYFQLYSNTYATLKKLQALYEEALAHPQIVGLSIGTRPDCIDNAKLDYLQRLAQSYDITIEYGIESISDETLVKINRGHDFKCSQEAIHLTANRGIKICAHIIIGFPWETLPQMIETSKVISQLPIDFLKIHQLHIVADTQMAKDYIKSPFTLPTRHEYVQILTQFLGHLNPNIVIQRVFGSAPKELLVAPKWANSSVPMIAQLEREMRTLGIRQGSYYN